LSFVYIADSVVWQAKRTAVSYCKTDAKSTFEHAVSRPPRKPTSNNVSSSSHHISINDNSSSASSVSSGSASSAVAVESRTGGLMVVDTIATAAAVVHDEAGSKEDIVIEEDGNLPAKFMSLALLEGGNGSFSPAFSPIKSSIGSAWTQRSPVPLKASSLFEPAIQFALSATPSPAFAPVEEDTAAVSSPLPATNTVLDVNVIDEPVLTGSLPLVENTDVLLTSLCPGRNDDIDTLIEFLHGELASMGLVVAKSKTLSSIDDSSSGDISHAISEAVDRTKCIVVFVDSVINDSSSKGSSGDSLIRYECLHALRTRGESIFLPVAAANDPGNNKHDLLKHICRTQSAVQLSPFLLHNDFDGMCQHLYTRIQRRIGVKTPRKQAQSSARDECETAHKHQLLSPSSLSISTRTTFESASTASLTSPVQSKDSVDVYFSYHRNKECHKIVSAICSYLQTHKQLTVAGNHLLRQLRTEQEKNEYLQTVNSGINKCKVFVFIVTPRYVETVNGGAPTPRASSSVSVNACRYEYLHALRACSEARMLPVVIDNSMINKIDSNMVEKNSKWLGLLSPSHMSLPLVDLSELQSAAGDDKNFEKLCNQLYRHIQQKM
jgi:hypothetical protein